jgi:hypothetical protein
VLIRNTPLDWRVCFRCKRQRNIGKRQRNIASLRSNATATTARFWKKWLRLGEWWLRRWILSVSRLSFDSLVYACVATKPAFAHLRRCALARLSEAPTVPTLTRRGAAIELRQSVEAQGREGGLSRPTIRRARLNHIRASKSKCGRRSRSYDCCMGHRP